MKEQTDNVHIRPYQARDLASLYEICLRTGAAGADATDLVEDPRLFGEIYSAPYAVLQSQHAHVLDDGSGRAVGYVLGALDTAAFEARCEAEWWPPLRDAHPIIAGGTRLDDLLIHLIHHRSTPPASLLARYPSHLHIDLLPEAQGGGWGRRLLEAVHASLAAAGSAGVHWGVSTTNERALGFYRHLGASELHADGTIVTFGQRL